MSTAKSILRTIKEKQGDKLFRARKTAGLTSDRLAKQLYEKSEGKYNYTAAAIYAWEKGRNEFPEVLVPLLVEILGCLPTDLIINDSDRLDVAPPVRSPSPAEKKQNPTYTLSSSTLLNYAITLEDLDLLREIIPRVGGSIPAKTAIELLECRMNSTEKT